MTRFALIFLAAAGLFDSCRTPVDCTPVDCSRPVACCAGTCSESFNPAPPPAYKLEDCCSCGGRAHVLDCPPSTHCFKDWQMSGVR